MIPHRSLFKDIISIFLHLFPARDVYQCVFLANKSRNLGSTRFLKRFLHWSGPVVSVFLHLHNHVGLTLKSSMSHTIAAKTESTASNFPRNKSLKGADVETLDPSHVQNVWSWAWHFVFLWRGHAEKFKPVSETAQGCQAKNWALLNSRHSQALYLNFPFLELDLILQTMHTASWTGNQEAGRHTLPRASSRNGDDPPGFNERNWCELDANPSKAFRFQWAAIRVAAKTCESFKKLGTTDKSGIIPLTDTKNSEKVFKTRQASPRLQMSGFGLTFEGIFGRLLFKEETLRSR